jgi:hypothetical protein
LLFPPSILVADGCREITISSLGPIDVLKLIVVRLRDLEAMDSASHDARAKQGAALLARFQRRKSAKPKAQPASTNSVPLQEPSESIISAAQHTQPESLQELSLSPQEPSSSVHGLHLIASSFDTDHLAPVDPKSDLLEAQQQLHDSQATVQLLKRQLARAEAHGRDLGTALQEQDAKQGESIKALTTELEVLEEDNAELHKKLVRLL